MKLIMPFILAFSLLVFSCATAEPVEEPIQPIQEEPVPEPVEEVVEPEPELIESETGFVVTVEVYEQTFQEIEELIHEISGVISQRQYERWLDYLSSNYKKTYNDKVTLNQINEYPQLKDNGIVLKSLKDYFDWVVVPSRSNATLGEIVFVDEHQVIAYSSFEGKRAKLYELERADIDDVWKITVW